MNLSKIYSGDGLLIVNNSKKYIGMKGPVVLNEGASNEEFIFALNIVARCSYEVESMDKSNIILSSDYNGGFAVICFLDNTLVKTEFVIDSENEAIRIRYGSLNALEICGSYLYARFPYIWDVGYEQPRLDCYLVKKIILDSRYCGIKELHIQNSDLIINWKTFRKVKRIYQLDGIYTNPMYSNQGSATNDAIDNESTGECESVCRLFSKKGIFKKGINLSYTSYKIELPQNATFEDVKIIEPFIIRIVLESLKIRFPLIVKRTTEPKIIFNKASIEKVYFSESDNLVFDYTSPSKLIQLLTVESSLKETSFINNLEKCEKFIEDFFNISNTEGEIAEGLNLLNEYDNSHIYVNDKSKICIEELNKWFPNLRVENYKIDERIWSSQKKFKWEVDVFKEYFQKVKYSFCKNDRIKIKGCISEDIEVLDELQLYIESELKTLDLELLEIELIPSYKQGFHWIDLILIPKMKNVVVDKVYIYFKPFNSQNSKIKDEKNALPNLDFSKDNNGKWFDLPIRLIQELYPIDDVLEAKLNISRENVIFIEDDSMEVSYKFIAYSENKIYLIDEYEVKWTKRSYLSQFPHVGTVHPNTGYLSVIKNGSRIFDQKITTDLEKIWAYYQDEVLPNVTMHLQDKYPKFNSELQPFFSRLELNINVSEIDYILPYRQDQISSINSLHEDIYFVGLDYFRFLGLKYDNQLIDAPGLILPKISQKKGESGIEASLYVHKYSNPVAINEDKIHKIKSFNNSFYSKKISIESGEIVLWFEIEAGYKRKVFLLKMMIENNILSENLPCTLRFFCNNFELDVISRHNKCDSEKKPYTTKHIIGYKEYFNNIMNLKKNRLINTFVASKSFQNRFIFAVEMLGDDYSRMTSLVKRINNRPVFLIKNRHHANEVSSTNAAFETIDELLLEKNRKYIESLNIIILPFENVDGGALHHELQKENPYWKLHAARYNSLGKEFTYDYFNYKTQHSEALAYTNLWYKWIPDFIVDNHGVPSHEWEQQFSGYVSPWFRSFWLPKSLFYCYFWHLDKSIYPQQYSHFINLRKEISKSLNKDEEIFYWNKEWQEKYYKYAEKWMPNTYYSEFYENLIFYWINEEKNSESYRPSKRFNSLTALEWTTEVADETAQGEYLELCSRVHKTTNFAAMNYFIRLGVDYKVLDYEINDIYLSKIRKRYIGPEISN